MYPYNNLNVFRGLTKMFRVLATRGASAFRGATLQVTWCIISVRSTNEEALKHCQPCKPCRCGQARLPPLSGWCPPNKSQILNLTPGFSSRPLFELVLEFLFCKASLTFPVQVHCLFRQSRHWRLGAQEGLCCNTIIDRAYFTLIWWDEFLVTFNFACHQGMGDLCAMDLVPEPPIVAAALRACRRVNDYSLTTRCALCAKGFP